MSTLEYVALVLVVLALLVDVAFFIALLVERAGQTRRRDIDRVADKWWREDGEPCKFCKQIYVCHAGCSRFDRWDAGEKSRP